MIALSIYSLKPVLVLRIFWLFTETLCYSSSLEMHISSFSYIRKRRSHCLLAPVAFQRQCLRVKKCLEIDINSSPNHQILLQSFKVWTDLVGNSLTRRLTLCTASARRNGGRGLESKQREVWKKKGRFNFNINAMLTKQPNIHIFIFAQCMLGKHPVHMCNKCLFFTGHLKISFK